MGLDARMPSPRTVLMPLSILSLVFTFAAGSAHAEAPVAKVPAPGAAKPAPAKAPEVPAAITPPATAKSAFRFHATGAQVYACGAVASEPGKFAWTLKQPDATLTDASGAAAGTHGAGPNWTAKDGSIVTGKKLADAPAPQADAVPWLLLGAVTHTGQGKLSKVTFVQRLNTTGGKAPATGCDATSVAKEARVAYTADYVFFE